MKRLHLIRLHRVHESIGSGSTTKIQLVQPAAMSACPKDPLYIVEHAYLGECTAYVERKVNTATAYPQITTTDERILTALHYSVKNKFILCNTCLHLD